MSRAPFSNPVNMTEQHSKQATAKTYWTLSTEQVERPTEFVLDGCVVVDALLHFERKGLTGSNPRTPRSPHSFTQWRPKLTLSTASRKASASSG